MAFKHEGFWNRWTRCATRTRFISLGIGQGALEGLVSSTRSVWHGRSVLLTGHTGFKGGWLALWLHRLGAHVHGYANRAADRT